MNNEDLTPEEQRLFKFFVQAFEAVVVPAMENMEEELREDISKLSSRVDSIDRKVDNFSAKVSEHGVRISKLEESSVPL